MIHKEFWGLLFLAFVGWIFVAGNPSDRIKHACAPIGWTGNVITSLSALVLPSQQTTVDGWFDKFEYGCQYTAWRLIYQEDYNKYLQSQGQQPLGPESESEAPADTTGTDEEKVKDLPPAKP